MSGSTEAVVDLGYVPRAWQRDCHQAKAECLFLVLVVHRRAGKTVLSVLELIHAALSFPGRDGQFGYIAPELKQAKRVAWGYLKSYARMVPGTKVSESELSVTFTNGCKVTLYGADNPDSLRGIYLDGAVMDEIAHMKPQTWGEVVSVALLDRGGWAIFIGTVKGVDMLSELYFKALADGTGEWDARNYIWSDTNVFSDEEIAKARRTMTKAQFRREFENDFSAATPNQVLPMDLVRDAIGKHLRKDIYDFSPKIMGVDVAYSQTGDRSVIFPRQGLAAFRPEVFKGLNNMGLAEQVAQRWNKWQPDAVFIDAGRGEGVISRLQQLGYDPIPVVVGAAPFKPHYQNKRIEMWDDGIRPWLEAGGALPDGVMGLVEDFCGMVPTRYGERQDRHGDERSDAESGPPEPGSGHGLRIHFRLSGDADAGTAGYGL
jgi:hypothetical protein